MAVAKTIELSADSPVSFAEAVKVGVAKAAETVHGIEGAYVKELKAIVENGQVTTFRARMQLTFVLD